MRHHWLKFESLLLSYLSFGSPWIRSGQSKASSGLSTNRNTPQSSSFTANYWKTNLWGLCISDVISRNRTGEIYPFASHFITLTGMLESPFRISDSGKAEKKELFWIQNFRSFKLFIIPTSELTGTSEILSIQNGLNTEKETKIHLNSWFIKYRKLKYGTTIFFNRRSEISDGPTVN